MTQKAKYNPLELRTIRDLPELESLRSIWKSWPGTRDSDLDFFVGKILSRGGGCRPHVIVLNRSERPVAILVGLRERRKLPIRLGYFTVCQPEIDVLEFVYGGLRGNASEENTAALVQQVIRSLEEGDADVALWEPLDVDSFLYNSAVQLPRFASRDHSNCPDGHWIMNFPKGLNGLFMTLDRSQRSKLRRKYNKMHGRFAGAKKVRCFRSLEDLEPAISNMEKIANRTDKRLLQGAGFPNLQQIREQMVVAAENGWLRIYILYLYEEPAAFWMGTLYEGCLQADDVGYDPGWRAFSPGLYLFLHILDDLREEDINVVDFGYKDIQFKRCFGTFRRVESRVHIYAPTLRGIQLNLLSTATQRATDYANLLFRRTRSLEWARRAFRDELVRRRRKQGSVVGCTLTLSDDRQVDSSGHFREEI